MSFDQPVYMWEPNFTDKSKITTINECSTFLGPSERFAILHQVSFAEIKEIWTKHLWPQRQSPIEEISFIDHNGAIDMSIKKWAVPVFLGLYENNRLVAVTSFYKTNADLWRLRGTWIHEDLRGQGLGQHLISAVVQSIKKGESSGRIWTMARKTSVNFYLINHFKKGQQIFGYEFGPHVMMTRELPT